MSTPHQRIRSRYPWLTPPWQEEPDPDDPLNQSVPGQPNISIRAPRAPQVPVFRAPSVAIPRAPRIGEYDAAAAPEGNDIGRILGMVISRVFGGNEQVVRPQYPSEYGAPRRGTMEARTGESEGFAPPPLPVNQDTRPRRATEPVTALDPAEFLPSFFRPAVRPARPEEEPTPNLLAPELERYGARPMTPFKVPDADGVPAEMRGQPFGASGEAFGSTRQRRTQPRDYAADDEAYARELRNAPVERSRWKSIGLGALRGLAYGPGGAIGGAAMGAALPELHGRMKRNREIERAEANRTYSADAQKRAQDTERGRVEADYRRAQTDYLRTRPDRDADTMDAKQRQMLATMYNRLPEFNPDDPANASMVTAMEQAGLPVLPKTRTQQLRFVQDARTGGWSVIGGDRSTGEATARSVLTPEGTSLATTPTAQISAQTQTANRESRERIATRNRTSREAISELNRRAKVSSTRGDAREQARLTRAVGEITALENLRADAANGPVGSRAAALDKAAAKATEIRQLYSDLVEVGYGPDGEGRQWPYAKMKPQAATQKGAAIGRAPAGDGRYHYTSDEIRRQAEEAGVSYESLYQKLKGNTRVVIDP